MSGCMGSDKPLVSIVMAVYEPNMNWLREQLISLNAQTYPNLELLVRDDCSKNAKLSEIQSCVRDCISAFPYTLEQNEENLGSNKTFERLTLKAKGKFIAYCDQDDVWEADKIVQSLRVMQDTGALLVCSDVTIIDEKGEKQHDSITCVRPRHIFQMGEGLAERLLYRNFAIGCTMLVRADCAKEAVPFPDTMVHDHWLALWCAVHGRIDQVAWPMVQYRLHGSNQTAVLTGVDSKNDYYKQRISLFTERIQQIRKRLALPELERAGQWAAAREDNFKGKPQGIRKLWRMRQVNRSTTWFELIMLRLPQPLFRLAVRKIQAGRL